MDYRVELLRLKLDRREVARELGLSYNSFCCRLSGFTSWGKEERKFLEIIEREQKIFQILNEREVAHVG